MATLTKFIYGFETNPKKTPFGLLNNQIRVDNIIQNAGWFNHKGERLGQGDLTLKEMQHIAKYLSSTEAFFVLTEADSNWSLPSDIDATAPGIQYMIQKAVWAIIPSTKGGAIIRIREDIKEKEEVTRDGVKFVRITRDSLQKAFLAPPKPAIKKVEVKDEEHKDKVDVKKQIRYGLTKPVYTGTLPATNPATPTPVPVASPTPAPAAPAPAAPSPAKKATWKSLPIKTLPKSPAKTLPTPTAKPAIKKTATSP